VSRHAQEFQIVRDKFPPGTTQEHVGGVTGWMYDITSDLGDDYVMFAFWDGSMYKVKMVLPDPENVPPAHYAHYFRENGVICLANSIGLPTLEQAFAKSVLFATAWSWFQETGEFHF
jgi:hypothetical protein